MKKILIPLLLCIALLLSLTACFGGDSEPTVYERLNEHRSEDVERLSLSLTTVVSGETLAARYDFAKTDSGVKIDYTYESLATYDLASPAPLGDRVVTHRGSRTIDASGKTVAADGDEPNIPLGSPSFAGFDFSEGNFSEAKESEGSFSAKVKNAKTFCGVDGAENMTVSLTHSDGKILSLTLGYEKDGAKITAVYQTQ